MIALFGFIWLNFPKLLDSGSDLRLTSYFLYLQGIVNWVVDLLQVAEMIQILASG
jgi:hypothetical protein